MNALNDRWGEPISTSNPSAAESFAAGVEALATLDGDPARSAESAIDADRGFVLARCLAAYVILYAMTGQSRREAAEILDGLAESQDCSDFRTRAHLSAAFAWMQGDLRGAIGHLEVALLAHPRDLLAAKVVQDLYLFKGDSVNLRDSVNRIFLSWPPSLLGYDHLVGMRSFGLEENYNFEEGELLGRQALSMNPRNVYARHSLAHVHEMLGRRSEGVEFLLDSQEQWNGSFSAVHMWWHLSLLYVDEGDYDRAKWVYDQKLCGTRAVVMHDLGDRAALLWRLYLLGDDIGERGGRLSDDAQPYLADGTYVFNEFHLVIGELLGARPSNAELVLEKMRSRIGDPNDGRLVDEVGIPLCRGLIDFADCQYGEAAKLLSSIRYRSVELGGSHAQQDIVFQSALVAAAAAGDEGLARALSAERVLTRPNSTSAATRLVAAGRQWRKRSSAQANQIPSSNVHGS